MIKMIYCIKRNQEMSRDSFLGYWHNQHADLVKKNASALGIRRYIQSTTLDNSLNDAIRSIKGHAEYYDGVAELWWTNIEDMLAAASTPEGIAAQDKLFEDEKRFIDFSASCSWFTEENAVIG
jgi:uncharacterized protein (TIGR02118 family)